MRDPRLLVEKTELTVQRLMGKIEEAGKEINPAFLRAREKTQAELSWIVGVGLATLLFVAEKLPQKCPKVVALLLVSVLCGVIAKVLIAFLYYFDALSCVDEQHVLIIRLKQLDPGIQFTGGRFLPAWLGKLAWWLLGYPSEIGLAVLGITAVIALGLAFANLASLVTR